VEQVKLAALERRGKEIMVALVQPMVMLAVAVAVLGLWVEQVFLELLLAMEETAHRLLFLVLQ
jgi:hypothetical protein